MSSLFPAPPAAQRGRVRATLSQLAHRFPRPGPHRADPSHEQRFWMCFELELERARRHERRFAMSRLALPTGSGVHGALDDLTPAVRATDAITVLGDRILALWSEADRQAAAIAVDRLVACWPPGAVAHVETIVFPDDGLSAAAFIERLTDGRSPRERPDGTYRFDGANGANGFDGTDGTDGRRP